MSNDSGKELERSSAVRAEDNLHVQSSKPQANQPQTFQNQMQLLKIHHLLESSMLSRLKLLVNQQKC